jgi:hypothetical protein
MPLKYWLTLGLLTLAAATAEACGDSSRGGAASSGGAAATSTGASSGGGAPASAGASNGGTAGQADNAGSAGAAGAGGAAGASSGGASVGPWAFPTGVSKPRIMIVGDSISAGPGCYKKYLLKALTDNHYSSFEFVGEYTDDCGGGVRHSAVSCSTAEQFSQPMFTMPNCAQGQSFPGMSTLVVTHHPDLVMLQLGVNDVWNGRPVDEILGNYAKLIQQARAQNASVVLVVARIQKIRPDCSADDAITQRAEALVTALPAWAQMQTQQLSPVFVADLWTDSDWSKAETIDCVHPNDVGAQRMGMNWFKALKGILKAD